MKITNLVVALACAATLAGPLSGCARTRMLKEAVPQASTAPVVITDGALELALEHVIVRDGPGSWSKRAVWDEYVVRVRNQADTPLSIDRIVLVDSFGNRVEQQSDLRKVSRATRRSLAQHREKGLDVKAGAAPGVYIAGGAVATTYGAAAVSVGTAGGVLGTSSGLAMAGLGAATGGVALIAAGVDRAVQRDRINHQFEDRGFGLTVTIEPTSSKTGSLFFPIVPVPDRIEVSFHTAAGPGVVSMDLKHRLAGLHVATTGAAGQQVRALPQQ